MLGHNTVEAAELRAIVERIEELEDRKDDIAADIKGVYDDAKGTGFDVKTLRKIVALRKLDAAKRKEASQLLDLYAHALGLEFL